MSVASESLSSNGDADHLDQLADELSGATARADELSDDVLAAVLAAVLADLVPRKASPEALIRALALALQARKVLLVADVADGPRFLAWTPNEWSERRTAEWVRDAIAGLLSAEGGAGARGPAAAEEGGGSGGTLLQSPPIFPPPPKISPEIIRGAAPASGASQSATRAADAVAPPSRSLGEGRGEMGDVGDKADATGKVSGKPFALDETVEFPHWGQGGRIVRGKIAAITDGRFATVFVSGGEVWACVPLADLCRPEPEPIGEDSQESFAAVLATLRTLAPDLARRWEAIAEGMKAPDPLLADVNRVLRSAGCTPMPEGELLSGPMPTSTPGPGFPPTVYTVRDDMGKPVRIKPQPPVEPPAEPEFEPGEWVEFVGWAGKPPVRAMVMTLRDGRVIASDTDDNTWNLDPKEIRRVEAPTKPPPSDLVMLAAEDAAKDFGGPTPGLFNTAGFQQAIARRTDSPLGGPDWAKDPVELLSSRPRIVQLSGGCHWLILPEDFERFGVPIPEPDPPANPWGVFALGDIVDVEGIHWARARVEHVQPGSVDVQVFGGALLLGLPWRMVRRADLGKPLPQAEPDPPCSHEAVVPGTGAEICPGCGERVAEPFAHGDPVEVRYDDARGWIPGVYHHYNPTTKTHHVGVTLDREWFILAVSNPANVRRPTPAPPTVGRLRRVWLTVDEVGTLRCQDEAEVSAFRERAGLPRGTIMMEPEFDDARHCYVATVECREWPEVLLGDEVPLHPRHGR